MIRALLEPERTRDLDPRAWNDLLLLARQYGLLARLAALLVERDLFGHAPYKARTQMRAASIAAESSQTAVRFEINRILRALKGLDTPVILMKGSAYAMAGLPPARGRFVGDLDLMLPRDRIDDVERTLVACGWTASELEPYDQRYYREWAHEIPPLQHPERDTPVDIHHTIAPLTSRLHPDTKALLAAAVPLADRRLSVLGPADMVLHSCVHLFNDEVGMPLRDLFDLHDLLCHFGSRAGFWDELLARARLHGLGRPLYYMLRHTRRVLGTSIPDRVLADAAAWAPTPMLQPIMDWLFRQRFVPEPPLGSRPGAGFARWLLYIRAHWLRMPPGMLARHLTVKAVRRVRQSVGRGSGDENA